MTLSRNDLRNIAQVKLDDAVLLFDHGRYSNSYYLFGYAAEIALKTRIATVFLPETIPDKKFVNDVYSHDLDKLVRLAGLDGLLKVEREQSPAFEAYWSTVSDWSEDKRYDIIDVFRATAMRNAMTDQEFGVFRWLQHHW